MEPGNIKHISQVHEEKVFHWSLFWDRIGLLCAKLLTRLVYGGVNCPRSGALLVFFEIQTCCFSRVLHFSRKLQHSFTTLELITLLLK